MTRVVATIGLMSDTHMPERLDALPPSLFQALEGVDLVLHAGDVGELRVLEAVGRIAPVVAVHGNDDTAESQRELPYQVILVAGARRILLSHGHFPDREREMAQRQFDDLEPKLHGLAERARQTGATIFVLGHWHLPFALEREGVLLINPGALGTPNYVTRQRIRTVARLVVLEDGTARVSHHDLMAPERTFDPAFDPAAGFKANFARYSASILADDLEDRYSVLRARLAAEWEATARTVVLRLARRVWRGEREAITLGDLVAGLAAEGVPDSLLR